MPPLIPETNVLDPRILNSLSEPSLMAKSLNAILKPLSTAGTILDTPASVIRAGLHGDISRGLRGIFDPEERVSGSELLGYNPNRFTWSGLGVELLADPLNFVSGGLTAAGKTAARASKLTKSAEALRALNQAEIPFFARQLREVEGALHGLPSKNLLESTLSKQAKAGQRAFLKVGLPFTEGVPVLKGENLYKGFDKLNEGLSWLGKTAPVAALGEKFIPQYGASDSTKEIIKQARAYTAERSAYGLVRQKQYYEAVADIAKDTGKTADEINRDILNYAEYGSQGLKDMASSRSSKILNSRTNTHPKVKELYNTLDKDLQDLLKQGNERGLFIDKYVADVGYFPRQISFEGRKFIEKLAKQHNVKLNEDMFDDAFGVLERVPSFSKMRKLFRDMSTTEANDYIKKKFGVKFNLFDEDVGNLIASRIGRQAKDEAKRIALNAAGLIEGTGKGTGNVPLAKLLANRKGQQAFTNRWYTGRFKLDKYRGGARFDKDGKLVAFQTPESRKFAAEQLRKFKKYRNSDWGTFIRAVYNTPEKKKEFVDEIIDWHASHGRNIMGYLADDTNLASTDPEYLFEQIAKNYDNIKDVSTMSYKTDSPLNLSPIQLQIIFGYNGTVKDTLHLYNKLYHGTPQTNLELIRASGLKGGPQDKSWPSTHLAMEGMDHNPRSVVFGPARKDAESYSRMDRTPGDTESNPVPFREFVDKKANELTKKYELEGSNLYLKTIKDGLAQGLEPNELVNIESLTEQEAINLAEEIDEFYKTFTRGQTVFTTKVSDLLKNITTTTDEADLGHGLQEIKTTGPLINRNYNKLFDEVEKGTPFGLFPKLDGDLNNLNQVFAKGQVPKELLRQEFKVDRQEVSSYWEHLSKEGNIDNIVGDKLWDFKNALDNSSVWIGDKEYRDSLVQKTIDDIFKDANLTERQRGFLTAYGNALKYNEGRFSIPLAESKYVNLGKKVVGNETIDITRRSKNVKGTTVKELKKTFADMGLNDKAYLPKDVYKHMSNFIVDIRHPEWVKGTVNFIDKVNAVYRGLFTSIVPSYHVRNLMSGAFMNMLAGMKNPLHYIKSTKEYKSLSDDAIVELTGLGVLGRGQGAETAQIISTAKFNPHSTATKAMGLGYKAANEVDNINRYALYSWARETQGLTKLEAADLVKKYHFDYSDLTNFEKEVMRRSVLFYTFQRKNFPLMLKSLWTNPKFMMAYARATGKTNPNLLQPYWMNDAFTVGESEEGNPLTLSLGLPPADLDRYDPMYRGVERFGQLLFSQLNPLLTGPAEFITGKDLYFDRPAQGGLLERTLGISPLARLTGIAQRAADNPSQEALRSLLALNIREIPANQHDLNDAYLLRTKLKGLVRSGDAKTSEVVTPLETSDENDREQIQILNSYLQKLYKK